MSADQRDELVRLAAAELSSLRQEVERLREALEFYADDRHWLLGRECDPNNAMRFVGPDKAKEALTHKESQ